MLGLPVPFIPHSASLSPATATGVLSTPVPVSTPPTSLDESLFFISLVSDPLAVRFSVSSCCARRRSVSIYSTILVLFFSLYFFEKIFYYLFSERGKGMERGRETSWVASRMPQPGPARNPGRCPNRESTSNLSVCRRVLSPQSHTSQGFLPLLNPPFPNPL